MSQIIQRSTGPSPTNSDPVSPQQAVGNSIPEPIRASNQTPVLLESIYEPIKQELVQVEAILHRELTSDAPWVEQLLEHSRLLVGKRMRPVFLLLSGSSCGEITESHLLCAASLEMIHTATLIHDDVLDEADTRHHIPTANSRWGNKVSVLLGDYLFTHAFHLASFSGSTAAMRILAVASNRVCAGEMRQNAWVGNFDLTEDEYLKIISEKTAELCSCGCRLGALLSGADETTVARFEAYGRNLGIAFQIIDDILDLVGHPTNVGKTLGTDITNKKPTLPVIHSLANLDDARRSKLTGLLDSGEASVEDVMPFLLSTDSIDFARDFAATYANRAAEFSNELPPNKFSTALENVANFVLERSH